MNEKYIPSSKERKYYILANLLDGQHLSYKDLSKKYFVSRSSIANDIYLLKQLLAKDNVSLAFDNSGTYISGGELKKQKVLKRIVTTLLDQLPFNKHIFDMFMDWELYVDVKQALVNKTRQWVLEVPENYLNDIVVSTSVSILRGKKGFQIEKNDQQNFVHKLYQFEKYPLVHELLHTVEEEGIYQFTDRELNYLSYIVIGNGFNYFMKDTDIPPNFKVKVKQLINNIGEVLEFDFSQDSELETDLLTHLYQMVFRLQSGATVINPLMNEIKSDYSKVYGVVWYALRDFGCSNSLEVSDDEVAFVTIHFQASIERKKNSKRILFVCPNGIGTSSLISAKIRQILPQVSIIKTASQTAIQENGLSDVDLIISTVDLPQFNVPMVKISPRITTSDMKKIANKYIDLTETTKNVVSTDKNDLKRVQKILCHKVFYGQIYDRKEVIEFLIGVNQWNSKQRASLYEQSVFARESFQTTYLSNGFAIPHGDPKKVDSSCICVFLPDKPLEWDNHKVDVISLLMVKEEDKNLIEPFMNVIMEGINNKDWFLARMKEIQNPAKVGKISKN